MTSSNAKTNFSYLWRHQATNFDFWYPKLILNYDVIEFKNRFLYLLRHQAVKFDFFKSVVKTLQKVAGVKENAFHDFMSVLACRPVYIHSPKSDTDSFLIETLDYEIWVVWRGTQATLEDGFSLRDLYADVRYR